MLGLLINFCPLYKEYDTLYNLDLSGDKQFVVLGQRFKPIRVRTLPGCEVEFVYISDSLFSKKVVADDHGKVMFDLPKPDKEGEIKVIAKTEDAYLTFKLSVLKRDFWVYWFLEFLAGFIFFLFGLNRGSSGIMRSVGGWTRKILTKLSDKPLLAVIGGIIGALGFQSSTAVTVMVVSLTDLGLLSVPSAVAMNLGAGIGTTITVGILALGLTYVSIILMAGGYLIEKFISGYEHYGRALFGFGMAFFGIWYMGEAFSHLTDIPAFMEIFHSFSGNIFLMILISAIFAALVHSSALTIGIALSMAFSGILTFQGALAVVLGANIGTAFTAVLASSGLSKVARKVAMVNLVGRALLSIVLMNLIPFAENIPVWTGNLTTDIALSHIYYNLVFALIVLPSIFIKPLWKVEKTPRVDYILTILEDPDLIMAYMDKILIDALNMAIKMFQEIPVLLQTKSPSAIENFIKMDDNIDILEERVNVLTTKALSYDIPKENTNRIVGMAYIMEEIENAGDIMSKSIARLIEKMYKGGINLSNKEMEGIKIMHSEVMKTFADALVVITKWDVEGGKKLYNRRDEVKSLLDSLRKDFYSQGMDANKISSGEIYLDILSDMERVNFHIASIGNAIVETFKP